MAHGLTTRLRSNDTVRSLARKASSLVRRPEDHPDADPRPADVAPDRTTDLVARPQERFVEAEALRAAPGRAEWPVSLPDPFPDVRGALPEVDVADVSLESVVGGVLHHGAVIVRGLLAGDDLARIDAGMTRAQAARSPDDPTIADPPWYVPFRPGPQTIGQEGKPHSIRMVDSPPMMEDVLTTYRRLGLLPAIESYFDEPPVFTANKAVLRYVDTPETIYTDWHQDGRFMGPDVRSMNVWVTLTDCGTTAPGLDVLPRRESVIHPTGNGDTFFDWTLAQWEVEAMAGDTPWVRLDLRAGDGVVFDHFLVHKTAYTAEMAIQRRAIECWFFAPSHAPGDYLTLVA